MNILERLRIKNLERDIAFGDRIKKWSLLEWGAQLAGETGELCNSIKKLKILEEEEPDSVIDIVLNRGKIEEELADVIISADLIAAKLGVDLEFIVTRKFNEISDRYKLDIKL